MVCNGGDMMFSVEINDVDLAFHRAHTHVLDKLGGKDAVFHRGSDWGALATGWSTYIHAVPAGKINPLIANRPLKHRGGVLESEQWTHLWFMQEKDYTLFLLKWSTE
jgi:hypothetical protein